MRASVPSFARTTSLVARALGMSPAELKAGFRAATPQDLPAILAIRRQVIGEQMSWDDERYMRWRYRFEPRDTGRGRCLIVMRGEQLLGFIGTEDLRLVSGESAIEAVSLMDIMLEPSLDGSGLGIWLNMAVFEEHPHVIEIGANPNSLGLIRSLYRILATRQHYVCPLSVHQYVHHRVRPRPAAALLARPLDAGARALLWATSRRPAVRWGFAPLKRFDESAHDLFERRWNPQEITVARTSSWLNWRLFENPRANYGVTALYRGGRLMGYMAHQVCNRRDGLREMSIVDWTVAADAGQAGFEALLQHARRSAVEARLHFIAITPLHAATESMLWRLGFVRQTHEFNTVGVRLREPLVWPRLHDPAAWCLTEANTDRDGLSGGPA